MQRVNHLPRRVISIVLTIVMVASLFSGILPGLGVTAKAAANEIANDSLKSLSVISDRFLRSTS